MTDQILAISGTRLPDRTQWLPGWSEPCDVNVDGTQFVPTAASCSPRNKLGGRCGPISSGRKQTMNAIARDITG